MSSDAVVSARGGRRMLFAQSASGGLREAEVQDGRQ
jgi:hypothetical protein